MKRVTSFKAHYRQAPARAATPPPPLWEPLSPVLHPTEHSHPAGGNHSDAIQHSRHANGGARNANASKEYRRAPLELTSPAVTYDPPLRSAPLPQSPPQYSLPLGSPIEALADAAVTSQRTSPAYVEPPRRASHAATSPTTVPDHIAERAPKHAFARDPTYSHNERPAKRARSEYHTSPPYGQHQSRPATSHIPGWSYNVEQMADNGMRMYQEARAAAPQQGNGGDKMLSDAELLLFFSNVSAHTVQSPPSTAKRWSVSQSSPVQPLSQQPQQTREPTSPYAIASHKFSNQLAHKQDPLDLNPLPEAATHPSEAPETTSASQTQTPPEEETPSAASQLPMEEAVPAVDSKPKKHQGWPKGKPRGPRSAQSTSKRKRSTPKPKSASSSSTSGGPDQLRSPQSLPAEHPASMATNDASSVFLDVNQPHSTSSHNRRHSFSIPMQSATHDARVPSFRAQSAPLPSEQVIPAPTRDLSRPGRKTVIEQPDLICAACKSSDSEVKVGDGEQWIGCDGCKEWYHYACAGFNSEREVRDVNKFYCEPCRPKFGETTSRSTDAQRRYNSNLVQRFASQSEFTPRLTTPVLTKVSSKPPMTTPSITTSRLSRMEI
jgi:F-box/leucine-rich repeat protein 10/11